MSDFVSDHRLEIKFSSVDSIASIKIKKWNEIIIDNDSNIGFAVVGHTQSKGLLFALVTFKNEFQVFSPLAPTDDPIREAVIVPGVLVIASTKVPSCSNDIESKSANDFASPAIADLISV